MPGRKKKSPLPTIAATDKCNGIVRSGKSYCRLRAGFKTDHVGEGRCSRHGGCPKITHGRYSVIKNVDLRDLIARFEADPDPLNFRAELAAVRGLLVDFINRYTEWREAFLAWHASFNTGAVEPKPRMVLDIADAHRMLSEVTKIIEREQKIASDNAISRPDFLRLQSEMGQHVERALDRQRSAIAPETAAAILNEIKDGWLSLHTGRDGRIG